MSQRNKDRPLSFLFLLFKKKVKRKMGDQIRKFYSRKCCERKTIGDQIKD